MGGKNGRGIASAGPHGGSLCEALSVRVVWLPLSVCSAAFFLHLGFCDVYTIHLTGCLRCFNLYLNGRVFIIFSSEAEDLKKANMSL